MLGAVTMDPDLAMWLALDPDTMRTTVSDARKIFIEDREPRRGRSQLAELFHLKTGDKLTNMKRELAELRTAAAADNAEAVGRLARAETVYRLARKGLLPPGDPSTLGRRGSR